MDSEDNNSTKKLFCFLRRMRSDLRSPSRLRSVRRLTGKLSAGTSHSASPESFHWKSFFHGAFHAVENPEIVHDDRMSRAHFHNSPINHVKLIRSFAVFSISQFEFHDLHVFSRQDEDHGFTVGQAIQSVQRPLESTGNERFKRASCNAPGCQSQVLKSNNLRSAAWRVARHFPSRSSDAFQITFRPLLWKTAFKVIP